MFKTSNLYISLSTPQKWYILFNQRFLLIINLVHEHIVSDCSLNPDSLPSSPPIGNSGDYVKEIKFKLNDSIKEGIQSAINFHNFEIKDIDVAVAKVSCFCISVRSLLVCTIIFKV